LLSCRGVCIKPEWRRIALCWADFWVAIATDLARDLDEQGVKSLTQGDFDWKSADQGAATLVVAGFDPGLDGDCSSLLIDERKWHESQKTS